MYFDIKGIEWAQFILYFMAYLFGLIMTVLYLFCQSMPDGNTIVPSLYVRQTITNVMALILATNNCVIVPNLVKKGGLTGLKRIRLVMLLRTINTIILPIFASLFLLNDCGRWWTQYWTPCDDEHKYDVFNVDYSIPGKLLFFLCFLPSIFCFCMNFTNQNYKKTSLITGVFDGGGTDITLNLLSPNDICDPEGLYTINWSKCIRSFFYNWTFVVVTKFMYCIGIPFLLIFVKLGRHKLYRKYNEVYNKRDDSTLAIIKINSEYSMVVTAFESVLAFAIICPLILPVVMMGIDMNILCYNIMLHKMKWQLTTYKNMAESFPVGLLMMGLIFGQLLMSTFFVAAVKNVVVFSLYIGGVVVIDVIFVVIWCRKKRKDDENVIQAL